MDFRTQTGAASPRWFLAKRWDKPTDCIARVTGYGNFAAGKELEDFDYIRKAGHVSMTGENIQQIKFFKQPKGCRLQRCWNQILNHVIPAALLGRNLFTVAAGRIPM